MFVARERELAELEDCYRQPTFQMVVLYGRRRVGKTALLEEFSRGKRALMFTAQQQANVTICVISRAPLYEFFGMPSTLPAFSNWLDAFEFLAEKASGEKLLIVLDEFPYAAKATPQLPSALQIAIDRWLAKTQAMMVLCGSSQGFMEDGGAGREKPAVRTVDGADEAASVRLFRCRPHVAGHACSRARCVLRQPGRHAVLLAALRSGETYLQNVTRLFFERTGLTFDEPGMLMRQELRDRRCTIPSCAAIAHGANSSNEIADCTGIPPSSITMYLKTLSGLDIIRASGPLREPEKSKRSRYRIKDPAFTFWFRFVAPFVPAVESGAGRANGSASAGRPAAERVRGTHVRACVP